MTAKLLRRGFILIALYLVYLLGTYALNETLRNSLPETPRMVICVVFVLMCIVGVTLGIVWVIMLFQGNFDYDFEKSDKVLKSICDFLNRRNGGCDEGK